MNDPWFIFANISGRQHKHARKNKMTVPMFARCTSSVGGRGPRSEAIYLGRCFSLAGGRGRDFLLHSGLPPSCLSRIWRLADRDGDGKLNPAEFSVAMCLIRQAVEGVVPPPTLPGPLLLVLDTLVGGALPAMEDRHVVKCQKAFAAFKVCIVTGRLGRESEREREGEREREREREGGGEGGGRSVRCVSVFLQWRPQNIYFPRPISPRGSCSKFGEPKTTVEGCDSLISVGAGGYRTEMETVVWCSWNLCWPCTSCSWQNLATISPSPSTPPPSSLPWCAPLSLLVVGYSLTTHFLSSTTRQWRKPGQPWRKHRPLQRLSTRTLTSFLHPPFLLRTGQSVGCLSPSPTNSSNL